MSDAQPIDYSVFDRAFFVDLKNRYGHLRHITVEKDQPKQTCTICMESYHTGDVQLELPCGHLFHQACVERWLHRNETCPIDRQDIFDF